MPVVPSTRSGESTASARRPITSGRPSTGGLEASDIKRLKELERVNSRHKRLYADLSLENAALKEVIAKKL